MKTRVVAGIEHGATTDAVVVGNLDGAIVIVHGVVAAQLAPIGIDAEVRLTRASQSRPAVGYS